ncbi:MAG TPA: hypothetical protein PL070_21325 [Flavobacteriales bacterium]|nr:hypothetical protein [Flavobacteriales bacterium]
MRLLLTLATALLLGTTHGQALLGQEHWPDGTLKATRYSDGTRIHFITFHENGQVKEVGCFRNGRRDGVWKQYSDTGVMMARASFRHGERQGTWEFRHAEDTPMGHLTYASGRLTQGQQYGSSGELVAQRAY